MQQLPVNLKRHNDAVLRLCRAFEDQVSCSIAMERQFKTLLILDPASQLMRSRSLCIAAGMHGRAPDRDGAGAGRH